MSPTASRPTAIQKSRPTHVDVPGLSASIDMLLSDPHDTCMGTDRCEWLSGLRSRGSLSVRGFWFVGFLAWGFLGCTEDEGRFLLRLVAADDGVVLDGFLTVRIRDGERTLRAANLRQLSPEFSETLLAVPYGDDLVAEAEVRARNFLNAPVRFRGQSEPFDFEFGTERTVTVVLSAVQEDADAGPAPPDLSQARYIRAPWGAANAVDGGARIEIPAGVVGFDSSLLVFDGPRVDAPTSSGRLAQQLARIAGPPPGEPLIWRLPGVADGPARLYVSILDAEGRLSDANPDIPGLQAGLVRSTEWIASFGAKVPGSSFENPHSVRVAPVSSPAPEPDVSAEEPRAEDYASLASASAALRVRGARRWRRLSERSRPGTRVSSASAYDPRRGVFLLFGGSSLELATANNELWALDEAGWTLVDAGTGPTPRFDASMTYMGSLEASVLFGGVEGDDQPADPELWAWDGSGWRLLPSGGALPESRWNHALGFDPDRGALLLFGGCVSDCKQPNADLFEWTDGTWRRLDITGPSPRFEASWVHDPDLGVMLLVGGFDGGGTGNAEVWAFNGDAWSLLDDGANGPIRIDGTVVRNPETGEIWAASAEVRGLRPWSFDATSGTGWRELERSEETPPNRGSPAMGFHRRRGAAVLFGGAPFEIGEADPRTWSLTSDGWRVLDRPPAQESPSLFAPASSYDPELRRIVVFGGLTSTGDLSRETYALSGNGVARYPNHDGPKPEARFTAAMAYDPTRREHILYGGRLSTGELAGDTWAFSALTGQWRLVASVDEGPGRRAEPRMVLDPRPTTSGILMFGGTLGTDATETWVFRSGGWELLPTSEEADRPPGRFGHALVYRAPCSGCDPANRGPTLIGGSRDGQFLRDQWVWTGDRWRQVDTESPSRVDMVVAHDPVSDELRAYGGLSESGAQLETFRWDGDGPWTTARILSDSPPARRGAFGGYFPPLQALLVAGGVDVTENGPELTFRKDVWSLTGDFWTQREFGKRPLCLHGVARDPRSNEVLMYGGNRRSVSTQGFQSTWQWGPAGWSEIPTLGLAVPAVRPVVVPLASHGEFLMLGNAALSALVFSQGTWDITSVPFPFVGSAGVFDEGRGRAVVHGGLDSERDFATSSRTFIFSGSEPVPGASGGPPRFQHAMAYDGARNRTILHGGYITRRDDGQFEDRSPETWILDGETWSLQTTEGPGPLAGHRMAFDPARERVLLMGGSTPQNTLSNSLWEWGAGGWTRVHTVGAAPGGRSDFAFFYDAGRRGVVVDGGLVSGLNCVDETWILPSDTDDRPVLHFSVAFGESGLDPNDIRSFVFQSSSGGFGSVARAPGETERVSGVAVDVWDAWSATWLEVGHNDSEVSNPEPFEIEMNDPVRLRRAISGGRIEFRMRPRGSLANGDEAPEIFVRDLRLRVRAEVDGSLDARCGDGRRDLFLGEACDGTTDCTPQCSRELPGM